MCVAPRVGDHNGDLRMISFFEHEFRISPKIGGPVTTQANVDISRQNPAPDARIILVLKSFDVQFTEADKHLLRVFVWPEIDGFGPFTDTAPIRLSLGLRDSSGSWDDKYEATVRVGIIVVDDSRVSVFGQTQPFQFVTGLGPQTVNSFLQLNDPFESGVTYLQGFDIGFERDDKHVAEIMASVDDQTINVAGTQFDGVLCSLGLRDRSGFWDDPYGGQVLFASLRFPTEAFSAEHGTIRVQSVNNGPARKTADHFIQMNLPRERVFVGLTGFQSSYTKDDHHLHRLTSQVDIDQVQSEPQKSTIRVAYTGGIRDRSGEWDDEYASNGSYAILAVTQEATPPRIVLPIGVSSRIRLLHNGIVRRIFPR